MLITFDRRLLELNGVHFWRLCFFEVSEADIRFSCHILVFSNCALFLELRSQVETGYILGVIFFEVSGTKIQFFDLFLNCALFFVLQERDESPIIHFLLRFVVFMFHNRDEISLDSADISSISTPHYF